MLVFMLLVFAYASTGMWLVPEDGWSIGKWTLRFPTMSEFWNREPEAGTVAMDDFFDIYGSKKDNKALQAKKAEEERLFREQMRLLQVPGDDHSLLIPFFEALNQTAKNKRVRILHFGDSQIEGNRISGPVHQRFQSKYGGSGPGWLPVVETIPTNAARQKQSDNWKKFAIYGKANSAYHNRYGLLGAYNRFTNEIPPMENLVSNEDSLKKEAVQSIAPFQKDVAVYKEKHKAWFEFSPPARGSQQAKNFSQVRLAFGNFSDSIEYKLEVNEQVFTQGVWKARRDVQLQEWTFAQTPASLRFSFEGTDSPDFYGISLESDKGVYVDNIAMRGSSGTIFNKMDLNLLKKQIGEDHVAMIIMQFGGNSVPYIKSQKQVDDYEKWFSAQIKNLKRYFPEAVFLVIGPSDMAVKNKDKFETYPFLPEVRDALKRAAFKEKALFYDLFEAMGGRNSMVEWVNAEPPLASTDHVHFAPSGSNKVAGWLNNAFEHAEKQIQTKR
jgi:lysophospholipase L1-like esterase